MADSALRETVRVLQELTNVFETSEEEFQLIDRIVNLQSKTKQQVRKKNTDAKALIQDLTRQVSDLERQTANPAGKKYLGTFKDLLYKQSELSMELSKLQESYAEEKDRLDESVIRTESLAKRKQLMEKDTAQRLPAMKSTVQLYTNISNIVWDFDSAPLQVAGHFHLVQSDRIVPFAISSTQYSSQTERVNRLWELMEAEAAK